MGKIRAYRRKHLRALELPRKLALIRKKKARLNKKKQSNALLRRVG